MQIKLNMLTNASQKKVKIECEEWKIKKMLTIVISHLFLYSLRASENLSVSKIFRA